RAGRPSPPRVGAARPDARSLPVGGEARAELLPVGLGLAALLVEGERRLDAADLLSQVLLRPGEAREVDPDARVVGAEVLRALDVGLGAREVAELDPLAAAAPPGSRVRRQAPDGARVEVDRGLRVAAGRHDVAEVQESEAVLVVERER